MACPYLRTPRRALTRATACPYARHGVPLQFVIIGGQKFFDVIRGFRFASRVFHVITPAQRIRTNVFTNSIQFLFIPDDVFVIILVPNVEGRAACVRTGMPWHALGARHGVPVQPVVGMAGLDASRHRLFEQSHHRCQGARNGIAECRGMPRRLYRHAINWLYEHAINWLYGHAINWLYGHAINWLYGHAINRLYGHAMACPRARRGVPVRLPSMIRMPCK